MAAPSFLEKLAILLEVSKSSIFFIIALIVIAALGLILITTNRMNVKSSRRVFILLYIFIFSFTFLLYKDSLANMFEYLMNNLFVIIYFPNLAVYFAAIIITSIILWFSVFSFKTSDIVKNINIIVYLIMSYLLVVLLSIVNDQKLDVFNQASIYGNKSAQAIIELSSVLFIAWITFLLLYKGIMTYLTKDKVQGKKKNTRIVVKNGNRYLPKNVKEVPVPYVVKATSTVPQIKKKSDISYYDNLLTIEDYKIILAMLKKKKEQEKQVALRKEKQKKELEKFRELQELYGVRQ